METKICGECKRALPATNDYFNKDKKRKDGLQPYCNDCRKQYRIKNAEAIKARDKEYCQKNKDIIRAKKREYNKNNAEAIKKWKKEWYERNIDAIKEQSKEYYSKNKETIKLRVKEYREKNPDIIKKFFQKYKHILRERIKNNPDLREKRKAQCKKWRDKSKDFIKAYREKPEIREMRRRDNQKRRARERSLPATFTINQWKKCKDFFNHSCAYCGKPAKKFHQDHFVPVVLGGGYVINNIVPACHKCNESKNSNDFFAWYSQQPFYAKYREAKILKYLNYLEPGKQQASIFELTQLEEQPNACHN